MNYEVGKYYITRFGDKAMCVHYITKTVWFVVFPMNPHAAPTLIFTHLDGRQYSGGRESHDDIIGPWIDNPVVDWSKMPAWANYVTQGHLGDWCWWTHKPCLEYGHWCGTPAPPEWANPGVIPKKYQPQWSGDWKDSLVERPTV